MSSTAPVIVIVGRPNVGKSTLYNRLTKTRDSLVDDQPGVTRDRIVGRGRLIKDRSFWIIDTGGIHKDNADEIQHHLKHQVDLAIEEADAILLVVDAREGIAYGDQEIAAWLRQLNRPVYVAVNKAESLQNDVASAEFYELGLGEGIYTISAKQGSGVLDMLESILEKFPVTRNELDGEQEYKPMIGIVGRPNVGKSTLMNRLLGEERALVLDRPGTTRDRIKVSLSYKDTQFCLVDTAGVRRRTRVKEKIEKFSIVKTLKTIEEAHVIILVLDAHQGLTDQDSRLVGMVGESGRSLVVLVNKWDGLSSQSKAKIKRDIDRKLSFLDGVNVLFVSAKHGTGVGHVMQAVNDAYLSSMATLGTAKLNQTLKKAVELQPPPMYGRRHVRLKYAHQGGKNPPTVVIHGNLVHKISASYRRYLSSKIREDFGLKGTRIQLVMKPTTNPYVRET